MTSETHDDGPNGEIGTPEIKGDGAFRRPGLYGSNWENTFAGAQSFMRRRYTRDLTGVDLVVSGIPFDIAVTHRPGARLGPVGIRAASREVSSLKPYPWGFDPFDDLAVIDWGDCWLDLHNPMTTPGAIRDHAREILSSGARMLTLGGDHYVTYPLLQAHVERFGKPLSLVHFDAHCDTWADDGPDSLNHGTMFYKAVKDGLIDPERSVQIGIRTWNDDFMGIRIIDAPEVHARGPQAVAAEIVARTAGNPTYLTFDIDCLDPAFAPGTGTPVSGGLSSAQALSIIRDLGALNICGMDVVEVAPAYDQSEITALTAAHLACDMICLLRNRKVAGLLKG